VENVPTGDPRRVSGGPSVGEDFKGHGHSSTKRMDIVKIGNECALFKYSRISHNFREGQRYSLSLSVRISPRCIISDIS